MQVRIRAAVAAWLLSAGLFMGGLALGSAPALAAYVYNGSFGGPCIGSGGACEPGQFKEVSGVAVNEETGDVYVADQGTLSVKEFNSTGSSQIAEFNGAEAPTGPLSPSVSYPPSFETIAVDNSGSALDPSDHDVYVVDPGRAVIYKFSATGVYEGQFGKAETRIDPEEGGIELSGALYGVAVSPAGVVYVYEEDPGFHKAVYTYSDASSNELLSGAQLPGGSGTIRGFAVDGEGNTYTGGDGRVNGEWRLFVGKFNAANEELIDRFEVEAPVNVEQQNFGVGVDSSNNDAFVATKTGDVDSVAEFNAVAACKALSPCETAPAEGLVERIGEGDFPAGAFGIGGATESQEGGGKVGIAVEAATDTMYVTEPAASTVAVFQGPVTPPLPVVSTGEATKLQNVEGATVNGTVNPRGVPVTSCEFEYAISEKYAQGKTYDLSVPCSSPHVVSESDPLTGAAPVAVSAEISGPPMRPGYLVVDYRLKAVSAAGVSDGANKLFVTGPFSRPVVGGLSASGVSQFSATFNGTLETDDALVDYHFEYGTTTAYGQVAPVPDDDTPITTEMVTVSQPVNGLQAGTTYHYRLVASSPGGTEVQGPDETFTTSPIPAPTIATGGTEGVGVGQATLTGAIDPHGWETTYFFEYGPTTAYGQEWPTVPVSMGALEGSQPVVVIVLDLQPGTTYHYRLVATNGGGTSYGPDLTFTTGSFPVEPIKEPVVLETLLVPSEPGIVVTTTKKAKKPKKRKKPKPHHRAGHGKAKKAARRRR
jgi:hypothetical protein